MSRRWDAKNMAEGLIEAMMMRKEIGFGRDLSPENLTHMSYLDTEILQYGGYEASFALDHDWNSTMISVAQDASRKDALKNLGQAILQRNTIVSDYVKAIEAPLTKEFQPTPNLTREKWARRNLYEKAHIIATQRAESGLIRLPRPADYKDNEAKYEFTVSLMMLDNENCSFLRQLEDATQLCVIPPLKVGKRRSKEIVKESSTSDISPGLLESGMPGNEPKDPDGPQLQRVPSSSSLSVITASTSIDNQSMSGDSATTEGSPDPVLESQKIKVHKMCRVERPSYGRRIRDLPSAGDRGYTLYHGPWSYYVVNERNPPSGRIWKRLADVDEYGEMLGTLNTFAAIHPKDPISVIVMHSLDVEAYEEGHAQMLLESFEGALGDIPEGWDESLDEVDDDGEGEPYMRWVSESLVSGRK